MDTKELDVMFSELNLLDEQEREARLARIEKEKKVLFTIDKIVRVCTFHQSIIKILEKENDKQMGLNALFNKCFAELVDGKCTLTVRDRAGYSADFTRWDYNGFTNLSTQVGIFGCTFTFRREGEPTKQVTFKRPDEPFQLIAHLDQLEDWPE